MQHSLGRPDYPDLPLKFMSLQVGLRLSRNSTSKVNTSAVLSLTVSIISISIAYHSYYLYKELKQEQKLIWRHISTICRIIKEDISKSLTQEPTEGPSSTEDSPSTLPA